MKIKKKVKSRQQILQSKINWAIKKEKLTLKTTSINNKIKF